MNKGMFLLELRQRLQGLSQEEIDSCIRYYQEYFDEAGPEAEAEVISRLGSPAQVAAQVRADREAERIQRDPPTPGRSLRALWMVILGIFAAPIALPLAIAAVAVVFALVMVMFALIMALGAVMVALAVTGVVALVAGVATMPVHGPTAMFLIGAGLVTLPLGAMAVYGVYKMGQSSFRALLHFVNEKRRRKSA